MNNTAKTSLVVATLALLSALTGCTEAQANPDARFRRDSLLITPGAEIESWLIDAGEVGDLRVRGASPALHVSLENRATLLGGTGAVLVLRGVQPGTAELELLDGDVLLDTITVDVAVPAELAIRPAQNFATDGLPAITGPFGTLVHRNLVFQVSALSEDGREFDELAVRDFGIEGDSGMEADSVASRFFEAEFETSGTHEVRVTHGDAEFMVRMEAVAAEEVVDMRIDALSLEEGMSFSVVGLTADGRQVIGLTPSFTVDGVEQEHPLGSWLYLLERTPAPDAVILAVWDGLSAAL